MSTTRRIAVNAASNWANMLVTAAAGLFVVPFMLSAVGREAYGVWALLSVGLSYPLILERAFALSVTHFVAAHKGDSETSNAYVSASVRTMGVIALVTVGAAAAFAPFVDDVFAAVTPDLAAEASQTCLLVGVTFALMMIQSSFSGTLKGLQLFTWSNAVTIVTTIGRTVGIILALDSDASIVTIQRIYVIAAVTGAVMMFLAARRAMPSMRIDLFSGTGTAGSELWRMTMHAMARSGSKMVMFNTAALLVGWRGSGRDVALYDLAFKIPTFLNTLLAGAQNVFLPVFSKLHAEGGRTAIHGTLLAGNRVHVLLTSATAVSLTVAAPDLLTVWLGDAPEADLVALMRLLVLVMVPSGLFGVWLPALVAIDRLRALSIASIAAAVVAIGAGAALIVGGAEPAFAPAYAMAAVMTVYRGLWLPWYGVSRSGLELSRYSRACLVPGILALAASAAYVVVAAGWPLGVSPAGIPLAAGHVTVVILLHGAAWLIVRRRRWSS